METISNKIWEILLLFDSGWQGTGPTAATKGGHQQAVPGTNFIGQS